MKVYKPGPPLLPSLPSSIHRLQRGDTATFGLAAGADQQTTEILVEKLLVDGALQVPASPASRALADLYHTSIHAACYIPVRCLVGTPDSRLERRAVSVPGLSV